VSWKKLAADYLTFTRKERLGLLVIITIILGVWIFPRIAASRKSKPLTTDTSWMSAATRLLKQTNADKELKLAEENIDALTYDKPANAYSAQTDLQLFNFDPNTISLEGWKKLGIREKTALTITKYLSKGGHFYKAVDLKKIYGIHERDYQRLEPYIRIETSAKVIQDIDVKVVRATKTDRPKPIDINTADTSDLISLPGIGSKLASRIVSFRDKLGGFYSTNQISETYGLPDSTFQKIESLLFVGTVSIKKINVNTATKDELKSHPYIRWNLANAIVEYRNQHGNFSSVEQLREISVINEQVFNRIKFYLVTE